MTGSSSDEAAGRVPIGDERQNLRTPSGRFANFLKASERWSPDLLLGHFVAGLPDTVIALGDMRDTYAELRQARAELAAATARAEQAEARLAEISELADELHHAEATDRAARSEWETARTAWPTDEPAHRETDRYLNESQTRLLAAQDAWTQAAPRFRTIDREGAEQQRQDSEEGTT